MENYLGVKLVEAQPMTADDFLLRFPSRGVETNGENNGYIVKYDNGYISWSPRSVFEKAYKLLNKNYDPAGNAVLVFNVNTGVCKFAGKSEKTFEELVRPLIKYLAENHSPHTSIIITNTSAEIVDGKLCFHTEDYLEKPIQNFVKCNGCPDEDICTDEEKAVYHNENSFGELDHQPIEKVAHLLDEQVEAEMEFFNQTLEKNKTFVGVDKGDPKGDKAVHVFRKEECVFQYCPTPEICKENGCQCKK